MSVGAASISTTGNPLTIEQYDSMQAQDIRGQPQGYHQLIIKQLDRLHYILIMGNAKNQIGKEMLSLPSLAKSIYRGLRSIESLLNPLLDQEYFEQSRIIKKELSMLINQITVRSFDYFEKAAQWHDLLSENLTAINLIPEKEIDLDVD